MIDQLVLVAAEIHRGGRGEEQLAGELPSGAGERLDMDVRGRNHEVDLGVTREASQSGDEAASAGRRNEIPPLRTGMLEHEPVVVGPQDGEGRVPVTQTTEQVLGGRRARAEDEQLSDACRAPPRVSPQGTFLRTPPRCSRI